MDRRGFLSLLLAAPLLPSAVRVHAVLTKPSRVLPAVRSLARFAMPFTPAPGFDRIVAAGSIGKFCARPQRPFRPDRLVMNAADRSFTLLGVAESGEPQLLDEVPAEIFAPEAYGPSLAFDMVPPGQEIILAVHNVSNQAQPFDAMMLGLAVA